MQRAFSLKSAGLFGGEVNGNFQIQGNTVTFTPTQALSFDTQYTVNVEAGVQSVSGGEGYAGICHLVF